MKKERDKSLRERTTSSEENAISSSLTSFSLSLRSFAIVGSISEQSTVVILRRKNPRRVLVGEERDNGSGLGSGFNGALEAQIRAYKILPYLSYRYPFANHGYAYEYRYVSVR